MFSALFEDAPEGLLVEVAYGDPPTRREWFTPEDFIARTEWPKGHVFYGPVLRKARGSTKDDCAVTRCVWVDIDKEKFQRATLPPSFVVHSGHGWHFYWVLDEWVSERDAIEQANKVLIEDVDGDKACWNVNRLLRVPNTDNEGTLCELRRSTPIRYVGLGDFQVLSRLDPKRKHTIRTGDGRGYKSRSERDWAAVQELAKAGADDRLITLLFEHQPIGSKYKDEETHATYLPRTLERARKSPAVLAVLGGFTEREDGYYVPRGKSQRRISTFRFEPELLLDGTLYGSQDALVGTVITEGGKWEGVTFPKKAFTSVRQLDNELPLMGWQWLGGDKDVRELLPFLIEKLKAKGLPRTAATGTLGLHHHGGRYLFVGSEATLTADDLFVGNDAPLVFLETKREHPVLDLSGSVGVDKQYLRTLATVLPNLNEPTTIWPVLGWYAASPFKPAIEDQNLRFPILNVFGTKGSGKTTTIQRVMMPLFGQKEPKSYDANTTRFVTLSLLGSSNAVPIAFSEFRFGAAEKFLRYILLSYDTGHDPRGRSDQTTVDYPLSAPFSVDGEDLVADPAAKERILAVIMHPAAVDEGTEYYNALKELQAIDLREFGGGYIQWCLRVLDDDLPERIGRAREAAFTAFPGRLPDRVRNNLTVAYFGIQCFTEYVGMDAPKATVLEESLRAVFNIDAGRAPIAADEMVEDLVNAASAAEQRFSWDYDHDPGTFWFQLSTGYSWWHRRRGGKVLGRDAIRSQLREIEYVGKAAQRQGRWMYPVTLSKALEMGLDIPDKLDPKTLEVRF